MKELGIDENTIVIFTSDNGSRLQNQGGSNGNLRGGKGQTWDGGQRVPCIIRWPGKSMKGNKQMHFLQLWIFYLLLQN